MPFPAPPHWEASGKEKRVYVLIKGNLQIPAGYLFDAY